jgi:hypothetical protein
VALSQALRARLRSHRPSGTRSRRRPLGHNPKSLSAFVERSDLLILTKSCKCVNVQTPGAGSHHRSRDESRFPNWFLREAASDWLQQRLVSVMGFFTNLLSKVLGSANPKPSSTDTPPATTIESATAPSGTSPAASAVSSLSSTSVAPSTPEPEDEKS